jgi:hypothetical protein
MLSEPRYLLERHFMSSLQSKLSIQVIGSYIALAIYNLQIQIFHKFPNLSKNDSEID